MERYFNFTGVLPRHLKFVTWINIVIQVVFPFALAFSPALAGAGSDNRFLVTQTKNELQTRVYTLGKGESIQSVANQFNMSEDALHKLNQFRTFAHGFDNLQQGDEIDVPLVPLPKIHWDNASAASELENYNKQEQIIAAYASKAGGFLSNNLNSDSSVSMAQEMTSGVVSGEIQQWLNHFGTARVQLDTDKNFSLKKSQLDLLVPLFEQKDRLVFTQGSIHRTDDRSQSNWGLGYRWFTDSGMLGANAFLDYDLSRDHARLGLGGEYWRDFLKLGINTYHRLTNWKNSPDLNDYEERPANGWDVRAQYWVPSLPQLGGKLKYEQYYGDEVALFGRDNRQRNPFAITTGVDYTPVPLLTFSAEQRQGQAGEHDTRFGVEMNYQMGVPWQQQINPNSVSSMRSLAGSRYDLIERNNNIVLEYRKKEVIRLKTADLVTGYAGEQKSLGVSVNTKYGLKRIDWSASSLIAAGGKIVQDGSDWAVVMPAYRSGPKDINNYTVSGVALDIRGNVSSRADTQVSVTQAAIDMSTSTLSPSAVTLPADGKSEQEFVLKVNDAEGRPVDIAEEEITVEKKSRLRGGSNAIFSSFTRRAAGEYVMTVTAGTIPEVFAFTPSARNTHFASADVILTADSTTALINALDLVEDNAIADGKSQNSFRVTVVDAQNNPVPGQPIVLKADRDAIVAESAITEADGTVIVPVTSTNAGEITVTASVNDRNTKKLTLSFLPDRNTARIEQQDFSVLPEVSLADGETSKTVTARVTDAKGNAVPDMLVTLSAGNGAVLAENTAKTDINGLVSTALTSIVAGSSRVAASVNNQSTTKDTIFTGNNATAIVTSVDTTAEYGIADGSEAIKFRAQIKDHNGNPLSGIPVDWKSDKDSSIVTFHHAQTLTSEEGIAEALVTSTRAYSNVIITASTNASSKSASPFAFVADRKNPVINTFRSNKPAITANGTDTVELIINVTDTNGNPLSDVEVALSNDNEAEIIAPRPVTGLDGLASAFLSTRQAGPVTVTASVNKGGEKTLSLQAIPDEKTAGVTVTASKTSATAGQAEPVILTATVVDGNNNPVSGTSVAWQTSHNQLSGMVGQTDAEGKATVELTGTQAIPVTVTAVLYNGHKGSAQVVFNPAEPASENSQLSVSPQSISADGTSEALTTLILRDKWGNPVPGMTVDWSAETNANIHFTPVEKGDGVYQASVTGTFEGVWSLSAQSKTVNLQTPLALLASQDSAQIDSVVVFGADSAKADGEEFVTIRTQVKDKNGNTKLKGVAVGWDTTLGELSSRLSSTDENGVAEITLSSHTDGLAQVSAMLGGGAPVKADKPLRFTPGDISADKSSLSIFPTSIVAEKESATLIVNARDSEGNLLTGLKENISAVFSPDLNMTISAFSEVSPGVYEAVVSGKISGTTLISSDVNGTRINQTASLVLRADNDSAIVKGSISATPASATVGDSVTYAVVLTDANENALGAGIPVAWSANENSTLSSPVTRTDDSGTARVTLSRQLAGTASVDLILPSGRIPAPDVIFSAGNEDENRSELTLSPPVIIAGKETATLTLTLRDSHGNLLDGKMVSGYSDNSNVNVSESQQNSNAPGRYTMTVSSEKVGSATLSVKVGDKALNKTRTLLVKGDTESWKLSAVIPDKTILTAGDEKGVTYSTTVTDYNGNLLNNVVVSWQLHGQVVSYEPTSRTNEKGVATTTVISNTAGRLKMTAYLDADNHAQADDVTVVAGDIKNATFVADKISIGSDGKDTVTLITSLEDSFGNPVMGKTVLIEGADALNGFKLSAVQDQKNGHYTATGTSTTKGKVTLNSQVDGKQVGNSVTVIVGAITPDLRFDNAELPATWTKNFTASQAVRGMPEGVEQIWSSSDNSIATVDGNGKVTLLKSGSVRISVYTPGNEQYNQAMSSYTLNVSRADPGLNAGTGNPITAVWADGKERNIAATYTNIDAQDMLVATYTTKDPAIVTVDKTGKLAAVKPGATTVIVSTPETEQFLAASANVAYVLNKATADVSFATPVMKTTDEEVFTLQSPMTSLTPQASIRWTSSNANVVNVTDSGTIQGSVGKGQTRLTLTVLANDYYNASSGYYDTMIYSKPSISLGQVSYISKGEKNNSGTWTPVFTGDIMSVSWSSDTSNEFAKAEKVSIYLKDDGGAILYEKNVSSPTGSNTTLIEPLTSFWDKNLTVEIVGYGFETLKSSIQSKPIDVRNLNPNKIWTSFTLRNYSKIVSSHGDEPGCRETYLGREHNNYAVSTGDKLSFSGRKLLVPMSVKGIVHATQNGSVYATDKEFSKGYSSITSDQTINFGEVQIASQCWKNHVGGYTVGVKIDYFGKEYTYWAPESHGWGGNGDGMYIDRVVNIK